jgi:hypothetical protein
LIGDASDSNNLKRITVANFAQTLPTAKVTTGTIDTGTFGTTTSTAATITTGTITTGVIPTLTSITKITSGTGTAAAPAISPTGDTNTGIFFPAADTIAFAEGGTEAMRIDSSGQVGIGTTSPTKKLHVVGPAANGAGNEAILIDANAVQLAVRRESSGGGTLEVGTPNNHNLGIFTNGTVGAFFAVGGNLGLGTTSPVSYANYTTQTIYGTNGGIITFGQSSGSRSELGHESTQVYLKTVNSVPLWFGTNNNERMRIDTSGNVGIGTTSATSKLHISGTGSQASGITERVERHVDRRGR